jgi:hypothetical protein
MNGKQKLSWVIVFSVCAAVSGCANNAASGPESGQIGGVTDVPDQPGTSPPPCVADEHEIGVSEASSFGYPAADVISAIGTRTFSLTWQKGGSTTGTIAVGEPTAVRDDPLCQRLEIDVPLAFSTEDGAFDESIAVTLESGERASQVLILHELDLSALKGSYHITTEIDASAWDSLRVYLDAYIDGSVMGGWISGEAEKNPTMELEGTERATFGVASFK